MPIRKSNSSSLTDEQVASDLIQLARFEPITYQSEILGIKHQPWQIEATEAVFDYCRWKYDRGPTRYNHEHKNWFTVRAMHGPGKTFWGATLIHTFAMAFPLARIPCIAPKFQQLTTRLWLELRKVRDGAIADYAKCCNISASQVHWFGREEWVAFAQTASKSENLSGLHHDHQLVFIDEASGVPEHLFPTIFGAVATGAVQVLVLISNPTKNVGTFAESWLRPGVSKDFFQVAISLEKAPLVDHKWVSQMGAKYGADSPVVKIRCYGEFADAGEMQLLAMQWLQDAMVRENVDDGSFPRLRVSVDVADGGTDETVITVANHFQSRTRFLRQQRFSFPSSEAPILAAQAAQRMYEAWGGSTNNGDTIVIDSLGVGAGTAGYLMQADLPVITYKGGESSDDPKQWRNRRVQSYINLRNAFRDGLVEFAPGFFEDESDWDDFLAQLCSVELRAGAERVEDLITKEEMKRKGIKSPDMADSMAMQYATQAPQLRPGAEYHADVVVVESDLLRHM